MQIRTDATGLLKTDASPVSYGDAVSAINTLRDAAGGTTGSSVEKSLTRTPTPVTGVTTVNPGPTLFAADSNSVAFTRVPKQVTDLLSMAACRLPSPINTKCLLLF